MKHPNTPKRTESLTVPEYLRKTEKKINEHLTLHVLEEDQCVLVYQTEVINICNECRLSISGWTFNLRDPLAPKNYIHVMPVTLRLDSNYY